MIDEKSWEEFRDSGLFWWINTLLHTFGWAIVIEMNKESGKIVSAYPARVKFRGFDEESNSEGYKKLSQFMVKNAKQLEDESNQ